MVKNYVILSHYFKTSYFLKIRASNASQVTLDKAFEKSLNALLHISLSSLLFFSFLLIFFFSLKDIIELGFEILVILARLIKLFLCHKMIYN